MTSIDDSSASDFDIIDYKSVWPSGNDYVKGILTCTVKRQVIFYIMGYQAQMRKYA